MTEDDLNRLLDEKFGSQDIGKLDRLDGIGDEPIESPDENTSRLELALVVLFIVVLLATFLLVASVVLWPARSHADPVNGGDQVYLKYLASQGFTGTSEDLIALGHDTCSKLDDNGGDIMSTSGWVLKHSSIEELSDAAIIVGTAISVYCPKYIPINSISSTTAAPSPAATTAPRVGGIIAGIN